MSADVDYRESEEFKRRLLARKAEAANRKERLMLLVYALVALMFVVAGIYFDRTILLVFVLFGLGLPVIQLLERRSRRKSRELYLEQSEVDENV